MTRSRPLRLLDRFLFTLIGLILGAMVIDVTIQIVFRYVVQDPPVWTEELARYLFAWEIFLGAGLAFGRRAHIVVDVVTMALPPSVRRVVLVVSNVLVLGFLLVLIRFGVAMVQMTSNTKSVALELNMGIVYASLPVGAAISALYVVAWLIDTLRRVGPGVDEQAVVVD